MTVSDKEEMHVRQFLREDDTDRAAALGYVFFSMFVFFYFNESDMLNFVCPCSV